jgi:hypothetical protein
LITAHSEPAVVVDYEALREQVVAGRIQSVRRGLSIFLQRGMAAWLETASSCLPPEAPEPRPGVADRNARIPDEGGSALIDILANLALGQLTEVHA